MLHGCGAGTDDILKFLFLTTSLRLKPKIKTLEMTSLLSSLTSSLQSDDAITSPLSDIEPEVGLRRK